MKNKIVSMQLYHGAGNFQANSHLTLVKSPAKELPEVLFITSYPPRECGIATYSQDLIKALDNNFDHSFKVKVCALESGDERFEYPDIVKFTLKTSLPIEYTKLAFRINKDNLIRLVVIQHEFGFYKAQQEKFAEFLEDLKKPVVIVFHTVLPNPDHDLKIYVRGIIKSCRSIIVMTNSAASVLISHYGVHKEKISVIAHGTHLVPHLAKDTLKQKYGLKGRKILTTFGLLSSGKSIETTLEALPAIIKTTPEVLFLIIGKTHPEVFKAEGEAYRFRLEALVRTNKLSQHVKFINNYLALPDLLEYLQLTDIYLFTSNDPHQAVSGTFAYALSCGCPIISTPIPHAKEILTDNTGIIFDFCNSEQLSEAIISLLKDEPKRKTISVNALQKIVASAWENSAVAHAKLFERLSGGSIKTLFNMPAIRRDHLNKMTTAVGVIQFSRINHPDLSSGYTLDDNARALVAASKYLKITGDRDTLVNITRYLDFIGFCLQPSGNFMNYVDQEMKFTDQNQTSNLEDSNGRAIWALGYVTSLNGILPVTVTREAERILEKTLIRIASMHSPRAMAFAIKGLYYYSSTKISPRISDLTTLLADRLVQMHRHESKPEWEWFEGYLTYANSIMPEALLCAWLMTGESIYKDIAISSFDFLLSHIFNENGIEVISNKTWLQRGEIHGHFGEQPVDVAYTIMALSRFYDELNDDRYKLMMVTAFNWFLGQNRLHQVIYNPCTDGCYDGLEENHVNLNQGAESTISYLLSRLTVDKYLKFKF